jgi:prepilin-type N-terminal cleavage/methylation domain-containing protein
MTYSSLKKGFTLIELIVVIAIVAILAAVSIVSYTNFIRDARESRASTELEVIIRQIELAYYDQPFSGNDGNDFTVSYDYLQQAFTVKNASGSVTQEYAETRIITAINKAIEESSDAPSEIAQSWTRMTLLSEASTDTIKDAFLGLDQEAVLFVDVVANSLSIVYYTNDAAKTWEDVVLTT